MWNAFCRVCTTAPQDDCTEVEACLQDHFPILQNFRQWIQTNKPFSVDGQNLETMLDKQYPDTGPLLGLGLFRDFWTQASLAGFKALWQPEFDRRAHMVKSALSNFQWYTVSGSELSARCSSAPFARSFTNFDGPKMVRMEIFSLVGAPIANFSL